MQQYKDNLQHRSGMNISYQALRTICLSGACCFAMIMSSCSGHSEAAQKGGHSTAKATAAVSKDTSITNNPPEPSRGTLDTALYNKKLAELTNGESSVPWPVKTAYPLAGAVLPFKRIVAYYGNF